MTDSIRKAQTEVILAKLREGPLTQRDAAKLGITRLAARVFDLKESGHAVVARMVEVRSRFGKTRVAQYSLAAGG